MRQLVRVTAARPRLRRLFAAIALLLAVLSLCFMGSFVNAQNPPSGHGNWQLDISYGGTVATTTTLPNGSFVGHYILNSQPLGINNVYNLNALGLAGLSTTTGGYSVNLNADVADAQQNGSTTAKLETAGAKFIFKLTWLPKNGDLSSTRRRQR